MPPFVNLTWPRFFCFCNTHWYSSQWLLDMRWEAPVVWSPWVWHIIEWHQMSVVGSVIAVWCVVHCSQSYRRLWPQRYLQWAWYSLREFILFTGIARGGVTDGCLADCVQGVWGVLTARVHEALEKKQSRLVRYTFTSFCLFRQPQRPISVSEMYL